MGRPILRLALVAALVLGLSPSLAGAAQTTTTVSVGSSCIGPGQLCKPLAAAGSYVARSPLSITYTAAGSHCSNVAVHFFVDGRKEASTGFAPPSGSVSATVPWPNDGLSHDLGIEGEGQTGGCNGGTLGDWAGELEITYTPGPKSCQAESASAFLSASEPPCCSISISGHATREPTDVVTRLEVVRGGAARCQREPVGATLEGQLVRLKFSGSHGEGVVTATAKREVCSDVLLARARLGSLTATDEIGIPDSTPKITFRATRNAAGQIQVKVLVRHVLPTARCERPRIVVDGDVLRLQVKGSTATAHRQVISGEPCATVATLQYSQGQVTAHATREVAGSPATICHTPPP